MSTKAPSSARTALLRHLVCSALPPSTTAGSAGLLADLEAEHAELERVKEQAASDVASLKAQLEQEHGFLLQAKEQARWRAGRINRRAAFFSNDSVGELRSTGMEARRGGLASLSKKLLGSRRRPRRRPGGSSA